MNVYTEFLSFSTLYQYTEQFIYSMFSKHTHMHTKEVTRDMVGDKTQKNFNFMMILLLSMSMEIFKIMSTDARQFITLFYTGVHVYGAPKHSYFFSFKY